MSVCCECCVLSGRGLCDELIIRPEESYPLWCVVVCDLETSWKRRLWPTEGFRDKNKQTQKHSLASPFRVTAGSKAFATIQICREMGSARGCYVFTHHVWRRWWKYSPSTSRHASRRRNMLFISRRSLISRWEMICDSCKMEYPCNWVPTKSDFTCLELFKKKLCNLPKSTTYVSL
jgi:hypothetical protein